MIKLPRPSLGFFTFLFLAILVANGTELFSEPFPCDNDIYCYGDIIHTVQRSRKRHEDETNIRYDSKAFVDMKLKYEPHIVKSNFQYMIDKQGQQPSYEEIEKFVSHNFDPAGTEFEPWVPSDWIEKPKFLSTIKDEKYRQFASELNSFWKVLGRQVKKDVCTRPDFYSMICVFNPLIVPGGRFIEFYYWDQFWILRGLLHSEMTQTVKGMLGNFLKMVEDIGYIPNGGRIYYKRSQPPLVIPMFKDYLDHTDDLDFVKESIATLDKEFDFWMKNRLYQLEKDGKKYTVARYNVELGNPRPEAYNPDYDLVSTLPTQEAKKELYMHLKTCAESGIDFSSRWFVPDDPIKEEGTLVDTKIRFVIPVDLNALICRNARLMAGFHRKLNNEEKAKEYDAKADEWKAMIEAVFWNEKLGSWFDYIDTPNFKGQKEDFFPENILPLITGEIEQPKVERVLAYLDKEGILKYPGGVPSSHLNTGEQWDFPNAWAPLVHWFIESLEESKNAKAMQVAKEQASNWLRNNYLTYRSHNNTMFEKYDAVNPGSAGGGGEYEVVVGFGWSNGVVMDFLNKYGDVVEAPEEGQEGTTAPPKEDDETTTAAGDTEPTPTEGGKEATSTEGGKDATTTEAAGGKVPSTTDAGSSIMGSFSILIIGVFVTVVCF